MVADFFSAFSPAAWAYCSLFILLTLIIGWGSIQLIFILPLNFLLGAMLAQGFEAKVGGKHLYRLLTWQMGEKPGCPVRLSVWNGKDTADDHGFMYLESGLLCYEGLQTCFRVAQGDIGRISVTDVISLDDVAGTHLLALPLKPSRNFPEDSIKFLEQVKGWRSEAAASTEESERLLPPCTKRPFMWALRREDVPLYLGVPFVLLGLLVSGL